MDQSEKIKEIANFFWIGELSQFEIACINSFVKSGFNVKLWSYNNLTLPNVKSCDAELVLPYKNISLYKQKHHNGKEESSTAFSDAFRFNLIYKFEGWWFDTDCYCLKSAEDFYKLRKNKKFVSCLESLVHPFVGSAAFYSDKKHSKFLIEELEQLCLQYNYEFPIWGMIGPRLITNFIHKHKLYDEILDQSKFFSIGFEDYKLFLETKSVDLAKSLISNSYVTHIWHSTINSNLIEKDSLLDQFLFGNYENTYEENIYNVKQSNFHNRFVEISKLYHTILNRSPDLDGLHNYISSNLSISQIEHILLNSQEYKNK